MVSDNVKIIGKAVIFYFPLLVRLAIQRVATLLHSWTWRDTADFKNVVVVGGSFAGMELVKRLAETLPTGFKVVWIEKNSHLNYTFTFPRFSVMTGHEHMSFIPYDGVAKNAPPGIFKAHPGHGRRAHQEPSAPCVGGQDRLRLCCHRDGFVAAASRTGVSHGT